MEESFGNVFLEAMACGLPIVAHESSRLRWIVGDGEFLLDTEDMTAVAQHIQLARNGSSRRPERLARAAAFSSARIAGMYKEFFEEVIASFGRG